MRCFVFLILSLCTFTAQAQRVIHVNAAAPDGGDGMSWATAFRSLQDALAAADEGDTLWVAQGRYRPDDGAGITPGNRDTSFVMKAGLQVLGGFRGDETRSDARDPALYETVLTGDLLGNDSDADSLYAGAPGRQDNAKTVVRVPDDVAGVYLAGVTIRDASSGAALRSRGGLVMEDAVVTRNAGFTSIHIVSGLPHRLARTLIHDNVGSNGGAMNISAGQDSLHVTLEDMVIRDNRASSSGGGIAFYSADVSLDISNSRFERNTAHSGGAIGSGSTAGSRMRVYNTIFARNEARGEGGAILAVSLSMDIANSVFVGNRAALSPENNYGIGGAIYLFEDDDFGYDDSTRITNSTFYGNTAKRAAASIFFLASTRALVHNSVFAGGIVTHYDPNDPQYEGTTELASYVPSAYPNLEERTEFSHTLAEGGFPYFAADLGGNLDADPGLCNPLGPDVILGTADDDLRLCPGSPALDAGLSTLLPADALDLDGDGDTSESLPVDFDGRRRVFSTSGTPRMDIGAFEADAPLVAAEPNEQPDARRLSVRLYPNPVRGVATLRVAPAAGLGTIAVFDVLGREVLRPDEGAFMQATYRLDTTALPSGVYFVRVRTNAGSATTTLTVLR